MTGKRLLVTGSSGLVGQALKLQLELKPHSFQNIVFSSRSDTDLEDPSQVEVLFEEAQPTHVIHAAAVVGGIGGNIMYSGDFFSKNVAINTNVLEQARRSKVSRLISFMSTCVFPDNATYPLTVDQLHSGPPHESNFAYAYAKRMLDVQSRAFRAQWGSDFLTLIPTNIYGPHDNFSLVEGHVIPALVHRMYLAQQAGEPLIVWGTGQPLREFIFSSDVAQIALWALESQGLTEPLILSPGQEISIESLVSEIACAMNFSEEIVFDSTKPDGQYRKPSNSQPLRTLLPDFEFTSLRDGLGVTVGWFVNNYPNVRS